MKVYVGSSWKNDALLNEVHAALRELGMETLDFRSQGRWWRDEVEGHPITGRCYTADGSAAFEFDFDLMQQADGAFIVHPCGLATALEAGWFAGAGKPTVVWGREVRQPLDITWRLAEEGGGALLLDTALDMAALSLKHRLENLHAAKRHLNGVIERLEERNKELSDLVHAFRVPLREASGGSMPRWFDTKTALDMTDSVLKRVADERSEEP